jgi:competence protein ComEC
MALVYLSSAWVVGIYLGSKITLPIGIIAIGLLPLCLIPFLPRYKKSLLLAGFCLFALLGGTLRYQPTIPKVDQSLVQFYNDRGTVQLEGMVTTAPEAKNTISTFQLSANEITVANETKRVSGELLVRASRYHQYHYGDILRVTGNLETPPQFEDFDYKDYLAGQGVYSIMNYPRTEILDTAKGFKPLAWVYSLRDRLSQSLSLALPEPQGSLAQGILLGIRGNIPYSVMEAFVRTGTAHLLAISGLNISIVIGILLSVGIWLFGRRYSLYIWLALLVTWLYTLLAGMNAPVVRGAIMGTLFLIAEYLGRQRSALPALAFAAAIMVGIDPQVLWQASFQLSFLSMAGLIFLSPPLQAWGRKGVAAALNTQGTITSLCNVTVDSFAVSLAATLMTWPVIAHSFNIVSFVSLPATLLAMPAMPGTIVISALVSVAGLLIPTIAAILGWVDWLFLSYFILVLQVFNALPFSFIKLSSIHIWQVWCYYALLAIVILSLKYRRQIAGSFSMRISEMRQLASKVSGFAPKLHKTWVIYPLLIAAILIWIAALNMPDEKLHVSILDVGQGDAILIQTPSHQNILIDGGPSPLAISLELSKKLAFWDRTIDLVVLTQPQADHANGLIEVLHKYKVKHIIESGVTSSSSTYQQWLNSIEDKGIERITAQAGQEMDLGNRIKLDVLHPQSTLLQNTTDDVDNNGVVLRLSWNEISFLFTADIRQDAEQYLIAHRTNLRSTILKVGHHGSQTSTSPEFLAVVDPEVAVVSVGADNRFGLPDAEVVDRLTERLGNNRVYLTSADGTIEFITDGNKLWVKTRISNNQ